MQNTKRTCYVNVSDLALCQKCPALFAYKTHMGETSAWRVGIKGSGEAYGSIFHRYIARTFFEGAAKSNHPLHRKIAYAVSKGEGILEDMVRESIFLPFVRRYSRRFRSENLIAMAKGVTVWVKAMSEFFRCIPSLRTHAESDMRLIFSEPEQKLQSTSDLPDFNEGTLVVTGCYDALMFNPDRAEARLFEFKGYMKSDITVPLSQSLIYSWLIREQTGIVPSVEIIYLDEGNKQPDIFDSQSVKAMLSSALPKLFRSAFNIISLRRIPETLQNINLCPVCRYRKKCKDDMTNLFTKTKRKGSSLVNVLIFFLISLMITAQAFFFLTNSAESIAEEREMMQVRLRLDELVNDAKEAMIHDIVRNETSPCIGIISKDFSGKTYEIKDNKKYGLDFYVFYDGRSNEKDKNDSKTKLWERKNVTHDTDTAVAVFDLNYYPLYEDNKNKIDLSGLGKCIAKLCAYVKIFPSLGEHYFLIRARYKLPMGNYIMRQVVVYSGDTTPPTIKSDEEVFYWDAN